MNQNIIASYLRTAAPVVYGYLLSMLLERTGWIIPESASDLLLSAFTGAVILAWYAIARFLEEKVPAAGRIFSLLALWSTQKPEYVAPEVEADEEADLDDADRGEEDLVTGGEQVRVVVD